MPKISDTIEAGWNECFPDVPVVYVTSAAAAEWTSRGVPKSILIQKPFAPAQIITGISQL